MTRPSLLAFAFVVCSCGADERAEAPTCNEGVELIVAAGSHKNTDTSFLCSAPGTCVTGVELGSQPVLASSRDRLFFVARDRDLLVELNPSCGAPTAKIGLDRLAPRDSVGRVGTANPHDVAVATDGTLFVPLYNVPKLAFVKGAETQELDLSSFDEDGNPQAEAVTIVRVGGAEKAFVALERLDDDNLRRSTRPSQMLRIDVATRTPEATIELAGRNPFNPMALLDGALFLSEPGSFSSVTDEFAGIERFDTAASTTKLLVRETELGASVVQIAVTRGCGVAIVAGPEPEVNPTSVITFDPDSGHLFTTLGAPLLGPTPKYDLYGITWRGNRLYVGDRRRGANGYPVHVFERGEGCTLTDTKTTIDLPQAPIALAPAAR